MERDKFGSTLYIYFTFAKILITNQKHNVAYVFKKTIDIVQFLIRRFSSSFFYLVLSKTTRYGDIYVVYERVNPTKNLNLVDNGKPSGSPNRTPHLAVQAHIVCHAYHFSGVTQSLWRQQTPVRKMEKRAKI